MDVTGSYAPIDLIEIDLHPEMTRAHIGAVKKR